MEAPPTAQLTHQTPPTTPLLDVDFTEETATTPVLHEDFVNQNLGEHQELEVDQNLAADQQIKDAAQDLFHDQHLDTNESESSIVSHNVLLSEDAAPKDSTSSVAVNAETVLEAATIVNADAVGPS